MFSRVIRMSMFKKIASVQPFAEHDLVLWFADGETRLLESSEVVRNHAGYEALLDAKVFCGARLAAEGYGVSWDDGLDMGCKELYECSKEINVVDLEGQRLISGVVEARHEKGLSQAKLASAAGVKQPVVARLETGVNSPRLDTLLKVLTPLGKTLEVVDLK